MRSRLAQLRCRSLFVLPGPVSLGGGRFLEHEYGAPTELTGTPYQLARRTDAATAEQLRGRARLRVMTRTDGTLFVLFESRFRLERLQSEHPEWVFLTTVGSRTARGD